MEFKSLPLRLELLQALSDNSYLLPTPIQALAIPKMLAQHEVLAKAATGSGKTAAYAVSMLNDLELEPTELQGLVLCPTRELANQVATEMRKLASRLPNCKILTLTGGHSSYEQIQSIEAKIHLAVCTPGRILDLLERDKINPDFLKHVVLDEADKLLEMGFYEEIQKFVNYIPKKAKLHLFSATFPESILQLSERLQVNRALVTLDESEDMKPDIQQIAYELEDRESKIKTLIRVLQQHPSDSTLVFCESKQTCFEVQEAFEEIGISCATLNGDLEQVQREKVIALFRNGSRRILIATDIASRGIDIPSVDLVVNLDLPRTAEVYAHRIGRTARAGRSGVAVSLVPERKELLLLEFEKQTQDKIQRGKLGFKNQFGLSQDLRTSKMRTISISGGRKDKIRAGDILGALTAKEVGLKGDSVGKIEVKDSISYVAIESDKADHVLRMLRNSKIKGHKYQVRLN